MDNTSTGGRFMAEEGYTVRCITMMQPSMIERIDAYRWANRYKSQADAVRALIDLALSGQPAATATGSPELVVVDGPDLHKPLPVVKVSDSDNFGNVPLVVQWLNAAIKEQRRDSFTEDEIYRGAWRKPDDYQLAKGDRAAVRLAMAPVGWVAALDRGKVRGSVTTVYSAP
jgi:hypothetical protein